MAAASSVSSPPFSLAGQVAIVTGSSRGIGRAVAIHLAELGAKIVVHYITRSTEADQVAAEIDSEPRQVESLFDAAEKAFKSPLHILVNSVEDFDRIFRYTRRYHLKKWRNLALRVMVCAIANFACVPIQ